MLLNLGEMREIGLKHLQPVTISQIVYSIAQLQEGAQKIEQARNMRDTAYHAHFTARTNFERECITKAIKKLKINETQSKQLLELIQRTLTIADLARRPLYRVSIRVADTLKMGKETLESKNDRNVHGIMAKKGEVDVKSIQKLFHQAEETTKNEEKRAAGYAMEFMLNPEDVMIAPDPTAPETATQFAHEVNNARIQVLIGEKNARQLHKVREEAKKIWNDLAVDKIRDKAIEAIAKSKKGEPLNPEHALSAAFIAGKVEIVKTRE